MAKQYMEIKNRYRDAILLFRLGDFYEAFFEDAKTISRELDIVLTSREFGKGKRVPMAGIPHHAIHTYLSRLLSKGYKVAICEQVEDPKLAKGLVKREVVRVVTPGTVVEDSLLSEDAPNYLVIALPSDGRYLFSVVDISTGEIGLGDCPESVGVGGLLEEIEKFSPAEILVPGGIVPTLREELRKRGRNIPVFPISEEWIPEYGLSLLPFDTSALSDGERKLLGILGCYLSYAYKKVIGTLKPPERIKEKKIMILEGSAVRSLEIFANQRTGGVKGSLLSILDRTLTPMGARKLRRLLMYPLADVAEIKARQKAVKFFKENIFERKATRDKLSCVGDIERIVTRVSAGHTNPRELARLKESVRSAYEVLKDLLGRMELSGFLPSESALSQSLEAVEKIGKILVDNPPAHIQDGGYIRDGVNPELDKLRNLIAHGDEWLRQYERKERFRTGIKNLKVGYNKVFGYYIEISKSNLSKVPPDYVRKQTLVNAERFVTPELKNFEKEFLSAEARAKEIEQALFDELRDWVASRSGPLREVAEAVSWVDVFSALAEVADEKDWSLPEVHSGLTTEIVDGRHPMVEEFVGRENFVPNSIRFDEKTRMVVVTGPNMGGKSTYIRQVALIVLLAQVGSYVPAKRAKIGIADRIFTRVGTADDIAAGRSTFMVEMEEVSQILRSATSRSLILLDEVGRGTSTLDGLSIAWAVLEFIHNRIGARTVFATHLHELIEVAEALPNAKNVHVAVEEKGDKIRFLYKVVDGGTDKSYGINVAKLAGLPREVVTRAKEILAQLEQDEIKRHKVEPSGPLQLGLFTPRVEEHPVLRRLRELDINTLTPLEALNLLAKLREEAIRG